MKYKITEKELSLGEILNISMQIFAKNFILVTIITLIIFIPINIVESLITIRQIAALENLLNVEVFNEMLILMESGSINELLQFYASNEYELSQIGVLMWPTFLQPLVLLLISAFFVPLCKMGVAFITKEAVNEKDISINKVLEMTFSNWGRLFIATILYCIVLLAGCLLMFIPTIFFAVTFNFYSYAIILSNKDIGLKYSVYLVKGRWWKTLLYIIVLSIFNIIISLGIEAILSLLLPVSNVNFFVLLLQFTVQAIFSSYFFVCNAVWYLNLDYIKNGGVYFDRNS